MVTLLGSVSDRQARSIYAGYSHPCAFDGWLPTAAVLVSAMERLTGQEGYSRHTLLKANAMFGRNSAGLFVPYGRWCPMCLDPDHGIDYQLLAHSMADVADCPLHATPLLRACLACGTNRSQQDGAQARECRKCRAPLWTQRGEHIERSPQANWRTRQVLRLLEYCSDESPAPGSDWIDRLREGLAQLAYTPERHYSRAERILFRHLSLRSSRFTPQSGLRFAAIQSIDLADVFRQPEAACSPRLPEMGAIATPSQRRGVSRQRCMASKDSLERLLLTEDTEPLPGVHAVCAQLGARSVAIFQKFPDLYRTYGVERRRRQLLRITRDNEAAREYVRTLPWTSRPNRESIRTIAKGVSNALGVSKQTAEEAVRDVLREREANSKAA